MEEKAGRQTGTRFGVQMFRGEGSTGQGSRESGPEDGMVRAAEGGQTDGCGAVEIKMGSGKLVDG